MILKLTPTFKDYLWGGTNLKTDYGKKSTLDKVAESWEVSVHKDGLCRIEGGVFDGVSLADYIAANPKALGKADSLSLMVKLIDAQDNLSVQVHPDDKYARQFGDNGKTEIWYILSAKPDAQIYYGFSQDCTREEVKSLIEQNHIESILNAVKVKAGEVYQIEAGTVHAIGRGIVLLEVQQSSNLTYRLYDYDRTVNGQKRQLHIAEALDVLRYARMDMPVQPDFAPVRELCKNDYFSCYEYNVADGRRIDERGVYEVLTVLEGDCSVNKTPLSKGDSVFVEANTVLSVEGKCRFVLAVPQH